MATGDEHQRTSDSRTLQFMQTEITTSGIHGKEQSQTVSTQVRESTGLVLEQASSSRAQTIAEVVDTSAEVVDTSTGDNAEEKNIEEEIHVCINLVVYAIFQSTRRFSLLLIPYDNNRGIDRYLVGNSNEFISQERIMNFTDLLYTIA